jgi:HSP20 family protein
MAMCKVSSSVHFSKRVQPLDDHDSSSETNWIPNTDVYATEGGVVIKAELAGMKREDLELTVEGNRLRIRGQREDSCRNAKCNFIVMEINYGPFESVIELPTGYDLSNARATYQNGFLRVDVPVLAQSPSKTVAVRVTQGE